MRSKRLTIRRPELDAADPLTIDRAVATFALWGLPQFQRIGPVVESWNLTGTNLRVVIAGDDVAVGRYLHALKLKNRDYRAKV